MNIAPLFWLAPFASLVALGFAFIFYRGMMAASAGTSMMQDIGNHVRSGAMVYLKQQYKVMLVVFGAFALISAVVAFGFRMQSPWTPATFLCGGLFSALAGFIGMRTATNAATRVAAAAMECLGAALRLSFRSGAVMGLTVVGLGLPERERVVSCRQGLHAGRG